MVAEVLNLVSDSYNDLDQEITESDNTLKNIISNPKFLKP